MSLIKSWFTLALFAMLGVSITINILQARYIGHFIDRSEQTALKGALAVGAKVPPLDVVDLSGKRSKLVYSDTSKPTVLYIFRPSCIWCQRNAGALRELAERASDQYRIVGISLSSKGLADFVQSHAMTFPVYSGLTPALIATYHLGTTPETVVISPSGNVRGSWNGAYVGGTKTAVERFFSLSFRSPRPEAH